MSRLTVSSIELDSMDVDTIKFIMIILQIQKTVSLRNIYKSNNKTLSEIWFFSISYTKVLIGSFNINGIKFAIPIKISFLRFIPLAQKTKNKTNGIKYWK